MKILFLVIAMCFAWQSVEAKTYKISSNDIDVCQQYINNNDVAYQPDPSVALNGFDFRFANKIIHIPLEYDAIQALGVNSPAFDNLDSKTQLGMLEIHPDGRIVFDGQDITKSDLHQLCEDRNGSPLMGTVEDIIEGQSDE